MGKVTVGLLSAALVVSAVTLTPMALAEKKTSTISNKINQAAGKVDMANVDIERLGKALIKQGKIKKGMTRAQVEQAVRQYVQARSIPQGIDTSSSFGKKAKKGLTGVRAANAEKAGEGKIKKTSGVHTDNIAMALVEFPDNTHNSIKEEKGSLYTKDFSQSHYEKMLFSSKYETPEGLKLLTMKKYYNEQSNGSWNVSGTVTPWLKAKENASFYGGNNGDNDKAPRELVAETLDNIGNAIKGNEAKYDQRDPYDKDGDKNVMEPDGMLDNLMVVHAGIGEEAGGGKQGADAIWSHRWTLKTPTAIPGTKLKAYDYMIQPEDGASGVFSHEYGHNLGLPDLYDTTYGGQGSPVGSWSVMSGGSWNGKVAGTEPVGFDPWSKLYLQTTYGGSWSHPNEINVKDIGSRGKDVKLNEAVSKDLFGKTLKINLPDVEKKAPTKPKTGKKSYYSTTGDNWNTKMTSNTIDLSGAKKAELSFDSWRKIETGYDSLTINAIDEKGDKKEVKTYDDDTEGQWKSETIDLSAFAGKKIKLEFNYVTDGGLSLDGFYVDNIVVNADGKKVLEDGAEGKSQFKLSGFKVFDGSGTMHPNYYLVEWRTLNSVDKGLKYLRRGNSFIKYDPGAVIWYYDGRYNENNTSQHPGFGQIGVVDAHQQLKYWNNDYTKVASDRYLLNDAAFGLNRTTPVNIKDFGELGDLKAPSYAGVSTFKDTKNYSEPGAGSVGKILPKLGLQIKVKSESNDGKKAVINISKK
ncbi:immune inhibitor A [Marininema mesophilum]|uniref:Immune inhibitor A n=1 Tax=Marininema mesophilum TaxID=1048340 RepID=A0A1H2V926_9BACL|nr:immune inhibitor A domain-containing protein [Marininema mesophilum]SDW64394.1 immune inhibitor A [Marininema mesophilum]